MKKSWNDYPSKFLKERNPATDTKYQYHFQLFPKIKTHEQQNHHLNYKIYNLTTNAETQNLTTNKYLDHIDGLNDTGSKHSRCTSIDEGLHSRPNTRWFRLLLSHISLLFSLNQNSKRRRHRERWFLRRKTRGFLVHTLIILGRDTIYTTHPHRHPL